MAKTDTEKFCEAFRKIEGALPLVRRDVHANVLRTSSPSMNFIFGNGHGLPRGYSMLFWGEPKSGKSLMTLDMAGQVHRTDPTAIVIKYDAEYRDEAQVTPEFAAAFGIDLVRYIVLQVNSPKDVFDGFVNKVVPLLENGANVPLMIYDSTTAIQGQKEENAESIETFLIGDHAQTIGKGMKRIMPYWRAHKIGVVMTAHARAEMDLFEQKKGRKVKAAAAYAFKHLCEYFVQVAANNTKSGRQDELENDLVDESRRDSVDKAEQTGHKIRVWMQGSTLGPEGRTGEFTFDNRYGIVNQHEEVYRLAVRWGLVERPNATTYKYGEKSWRGKPAFLEALRDNPDLQKSLIEDLQKAEKDRKIGSVQQFQDAADVAAAFADE